MPLDSRAIAGRQESMPIKGSQERGMAKKILRPVALSGSVSKPQADGTAPESGWRQTLAFVQGEGEAKSTEPSVRIACAPSVMLQVHCMSRSSV